MNRGTPSCPAHWCRALGTAELIARACDLPAPTTDADLVERNYGEGSGMYDHEILARWPDWVLPGSETRADVFHRAMPALDRLADLWPDGRVVVVSHGGLIRSVVMGVEGESESTRENVANLDPHRSSRLCVDVDYYNRYDRRQRD